MKSISTNNHKKRDNSIDLMKSILVILMIASHVIDILKLDGIFYYVSLYVKLTTFSGFMFTFGYVCNTAYFTKRPDEVLWSKLCVRMFKTILAFYISGISYILFIDHSFNLGKIELLYKIEQVLTFSEIPGYSEFLLSFAFLYPLIFVFTYIIFKYIKNVKPWHLIVLSVISLCLTKFDYGLINAPVLGVFLGTYTFFCFPIFQYLSYFVAGMYLSLTKKKLNKVIFAIAVLGTLYFGVNVFVYGNIPERFSPSIGWIVGGYLFVYLYFIICNKFSKYFENYQKLLMIGKNSLVFLVVSNIVIFIMSNFASYFSQSKLQSYIYAIIIFALCFLFSFLWLLIKKLFNKLIMQKKLDCNNKHKNNIVK